MEASEAETFASFRVICLDVYKRQALQGELSVGTFFVFLMYESTIVWPLRQLGRILSDLGKVSVSITRIEEVLNEEAEDLESGLRPDISGNICFDHVKMCIRDRFCVGCYGGRSCQ